MGSWPWPLTHNIVLYLIAATASGLTAFYMGRLFFVAFWGDPAASHHKGHGHEVHESPAVMTFPLIFLGHPFCHRRIYRDPSLLISSRST